MSKHCGVLAAVLMALVTTPVIVDAQAKSSSLHTQERVVDSLGAIWMLTHTRLVAFDDSMRRANDLRDTLHIGALNLLVDAPLRARIERLAPIAAAQVDSIAGTATKKLASAWTVIRRQRASNDTLVVTSVGRISGLEYWGAPSDSLLIVWLRDEAVRQLHSTINQEFKEWLRYAFTPDSVRSEAWTRLRLQAVSSDFVVMRRCYAGDTPSCSLALGLTVATDPATQLLDSAGRRARVANARLYNNWFMSRAKEASHCVSDNDDAACIAAIRRFNKQLDVSTAGRVALVQLATQMGGKKGFEHLLNSNGTPAERIAAAAGVPADSVLREWQRRVRDTRLPSQDMSPVIALGSLVWVLACGALAMGSSRWR